MLYIPANNNYTQLLDFCISLFHLFATLSLLVYETRQRMTGSQPFVRLTVQPFCGSVCTVKNCGLTVVTHSFNTGPTDSRTMTILTSHMLLQTLVILGYGQMKMKLSFYHSSVIQQVKYLNFCQNSF